VAAASRCGGIMKTTLFVHDTTKNLSAELGWLVHPYRRCCCHPLWHYEKSSALFEQKM